MVIDLNKGLNMSNEQKARQSVAPMVGARNSETRTLKALRRARSKRIVESQGRPLNVLGCFALIHAIRTIDSGKRSGTATVA
jgi:hypothetical protein